MGDGIWRAARSGLVAGALALAACTADPAAQLERVAKDWSLTIRAAQVIPVYPLTEDIQPGDVFMVPVPIAEQVKTYEKKGFLPTDQLVTRLAKVDYPGFYADGYWQGDFAPVPHPRPGPGVERVRAPRAAFPSYSFEVDRAAGLKLALPIQGVPVGLGLMGAARAAGTVTIRDAYTYGADSAALYRELRAWHELDRGIRDTLAAMAGQSEAEIYLRVVTRVYLAGALDVSLVNLESISGGADIGAARSISLPDLSSDDPAKVKAAAEAYREALDALSGALNAGAAGGALVPGGSARFTRVDRRSVSMVQSFDRPLVIGFLGFDVKVLADGGLSAPIPSFTVLSADVDPGAFTESIPFTADDGLSDAYVAWLAEPGNRERMIAFLRARAIDRDPADLAYNAELRALLRAARAELGF